MFVNILILILEIIYYYVILIKVIKNRHKLLLFIGIGLSIVLTGLIFGSSIFRYFALPLLIYIILKLLYKRTCISIFFTITIILLYKLTIEFIFMKLLLEIFSPIIITFIFEFLLIISALLFSRYIRKFNILIQKKWKGIHDFYFRYLFLTTYNIFILFCIYNLIKMKEVL